MRRIVPALALAMLCGPLAAGEVYRCTDAAGKVEFRDTPCAAANAARKLDVQPNSVGTMTADELRAKTAESKAKREARQRAEAQAEATELEARRRAYLDERAHQDALDTQEAIRKGADPPPGAYWDGFSRRPPKVEVVVKPAPTAPAKPAAPK